MQQEQNRTNVTETSQGHDRRQAMKKILVGVGALAGYSVLPEQWIRPVIGQVVLPAHAETSGIVPVEESTVEPAAEEKPTETAADGEYNTEEVYSLRNAPGNNKRFTWLDETGSYYGGQVRFVFGDCGELVVPDASRSYGADGTTTNKDQAYYFCGTDFQPGEAEYNNGKASIFTPPGCKAANVVIHYNK